MIYIRNNNEVEKISKASQIVRDTLFMIEDNVKPGVSTLKLDKLAEEYICSFDATPGFKGLYGYPATLCISIDDEVVHGIPSDKILNEGSIVSIDVGAIYDGYYGDHAKTFPVGNISNSKQKLLDVTKKCLETGINEARPGNTIGHIGNAIQNYAEANGFGVVRELVGHGIGEKLHEEPQIPNFGQKGSGPTIESGMCFAIEPMINLGSEDVYTKPDGWTVCTKDKQPSAHFEHTITITDDGPRILTI